MCFSFGILLGPFFVEINDRCFDDYFATLRHGVSSIYGKVHDDLF